MAKGTKKRKQIAENSPIDLKKLKKDVKDPEPLPTGTEGTFLIGNLIFPDELETTTDTLTTLSKNPTLIGLKALKPFKTAVYDYWRVAHETSNTGKQIILQTASTCKPEYFRELSYVSHLFGTRRPASYRCPRPPIRNVDPRIRAQARCTPALGPRV